ncbi:SRPBCC family protein [Luteimonas sp. BDR2-5]|uniref:SRPBCC family protein n=1 Tax=Proluteimonas luteida TaxID=2878685 RepID=UPI001E4EC759|nr:SRPBCC family protein [Luteimonas sp. BDR2-5]MCD9028151.1 SRPBCC family protein [Luteimonas sp. BDR2-5]
MTRLLELLISCVIVAVLFVVVAVLLPSSRTLTESVETNRRQTIVFDTINSLRRFKDWSSIPLYDPAVTLKLSGPDAGVGARVDYDSSVDRIGKGSWEIIESDPGTRVVYAVENPQRGHNKKMTYTLRPTGRNNRNIEIRQTYNVDYGWDLLGRFAGLYVSRNVGDDMKLSLGQMSNILASVPNVDYRVEGSTLSDLAVVDRPAENLLVVAAGAIERNNQVIQDSMKSNREWINRTMAANDLEAAGPLRIITTELGRETYNFDVALPVRKKGTGPAAPAVSEADDDGENGDAAPAVAEAPAADAAELSGLELLGPVKYVHVPRTRAAKANYKGFMAELDNVRNAVRAWALTQGDQVTDRPYEFYLNGIDDAFTENGEFQVYWTLRDQP